MKKRSTADLAIVLEPMVQIGAVVTITLPTHVYRKLVFAQKFLVVMRAVLRPAVSIVDAARWRPAQDDGHAQRPQGKILLLAAADGPADVEPGSATGLSEPAWAARKNQ